MRNTSPVTIAPTGTISTIAGVSSGIEPLFALYYERHIMDNAIHHEFCDYLETVGTAQGWWDGSIKTHLRTGGSLQTLRQVPDDVKAIFKTAMEIEPEAHLLMQAAWQKHTDNAVSKTVNLPEYATVEDIRKLYIRAYEEGCKGITVYRDRSKVNSGTQCSAG